MTRAAILGTGRYLPERVVGNDEVAARLGVDAAWILDHTGVRERRFAADDEAPADMACRAAAEAMQAAGTSAPEIDYMISAIEHSDSYFPGNACFVQEKLGLDTGVGALDVRGQAAGFIHALSVADGLVSAGRYRNVLLMATELNSCALEWDAKGKELTALLGDGSGAVVLGPGDDDRGVLAVDLHTDGRFAREYWVESESNTLHPRITHEMLDRGLQYPRMNADLFYEHSVRGLVSSIERTLRAGGAEPGDPALWLLQQGNRRVNEAVVAKLGLDSARVDWSIERYGNTSAASIPIALDEAVRSERLKAGDLVLMAAFGAGFTWGSALVRL